MLTRAIQADDSTGVVMPSCILEDNHGLQLDSGNMFRVGKVEQVLMPESASQLKGFGVDPECYLVCPNSLNDGTDGGRRGGISRRVPYLFKNGS